MIICLIAAALALAPTMQETVTYSDPLLGLAFTHPKTWTIAKRTKTFTEILIPIGASSEKAALDIYRSSFQSTPDIWQTVQVDTNKQLKRDVVRQYEQTILGVPLLLTEISWSEKGNAKESLTGLLYSRNSLKLLFRLTASADGYDKAKFAFQNVLESLHTIDGSLPATEDPDRKPDDPKEKPEPVFPKVELKDPGARRRHLKLPVSVRLSVSSKDVLLRLPVGWTVDAKGTQATLTNKNLPGQILLSVSSTLDSDPPQMALDKATGKSLALFSTVDVREDLPAKLNLDGVNITSVWRTGHSAQGELMALDTVGVAGELYFQATYRLADKAVQKKARRVIDELLQTMSLEPAS